jgi:hypothetical protein
MVNFRLQKELEAVSLKRMLLLPFDSWAAGKNRMVRRIKDRKQLFSRQSFFGNSGIGVDGGNAEVLAGTLSPSGRLFEIYFVRLIGTPNQKFKRCRLRSASS